MSTPIRLYFAALRFSAFPICWNLWTYRVIVHSQARLCYYTIKSMQGIIWDLLHFVLWNCYWRLSDSPPLMMIYTFVPSWQISFFINFGSIVSHKTIALFFWTANKFHISPTHVNSLHYFSTCRKINLLNRYLSSSSSTKEKQSSTQCEPLCCFLVYSSRFLIPMSDTTPRRNACCFSSFVIYWYTL